MEKIVKTILNKATNNAKFCDKYIFYDPNLLRERTEERLSRKIDFSSNEKEYIHSLAKNYAYYDNQCILICEALCEWLELNHHPSPQACSMKLDFINETSRFFADTLTIKNDDWQTQFNNILAQPPQKQRSILEYGYEMRSLKSDLLIGFMELFAHNEAFVRDLYNYPAEDVALYIVNTANQLATGCQKAIK